MQGAQICDGCVLPGAVLYVWCCVTWIPCGVSCLVFQQAISTIQPTDLCKDRGGRTDIYGLYLSTLLHYLVITNMWYFKSEENIVHFPLMLSSDAQKTLQTHKHVTSTEMVIQIYPYSSIPNNIVRNFEASGLDTASLTSVMWVV